jgi:hypothetical protein
MKIYPEVHDFEHGEIARQRRSAGWRVSAEHVKMILRLLLQKLLPAGIVWGLQDRAGSLSIWRLCRDKNAKLIANL